MDNGKVMLQVTPWGIVMLQLLHATGGGTCHRGHLGIINAILKESMANYISLESLINVDFRKNNELLISSIPQKKLANNHENDHMSLN